MNKARSGAIIAALAFLTLGSGCAFSRENLPAPATSPAAGETPTTQPSLPASSGSLTTSPTPSPSPDRAREIRMLEDQVSLLRGLTPSTEIPLQLLSPAQLRADAVTECMAQRPEGALTSETLHMLGLLKNEVDLDATYTLLAHDWAAGLTNRYDKELPGIALADLPAPNTAWRLDYAASYLSALRAAAFEAPPIGTCCPIACASEDDVGLAQAAFVLGDDQLAQEQWVRIFGSEEDAARLAARVDPESEAGLSRAPQFLNSSFAFVLAGGKAFVQRLYIAGGWLAIDEVYAEPPMSTEQILHPERYPEDVPLPLQAPDLSDALGPAWEAAQVTTLGEWRLRRTLQMFLAPDEAADAAADWGNDVLVTYRNRALDQDLLLLITRWDNLRQAQDFALAFRAYGEARFGERRPTAQADIWTWEGGYTLLERASDQTLWILGPDKTTVEAARAGLTFPAPER